MIRAIPKGFSSTITMKEAKYCAFLFLEDDDLSWYPMHEIKKYPKEIRADKIVEFADKLRKEEETPPHSHNNGQDSVKENEAFSNLGFK